MKFETQIKKCNRLIEKEELIKERIHVLEKKRETALKEEPIGELSYKIFCENRKLKKAQRKLRKVVNK